MTDARLAGTVLGDRYRLGSLIDRESVTDLYRAYDMRNDRRVHVRVVPTAPPVDERFVREARRVAALDHPYIVKLLAFTALPDGRPVLIYEPVDGENLHQRLSRGPVSLGETVRLLDQLLDALARCHEAGVIHRDLRPSNVLIDIAGNIQLRAAGLAQMFSDRSAPTIGDVIYGHPQFTAPEQWVNRPVDARTDLYAVALLGYLLLTGKPLVKNGTHLDMCSRHFQSRRPRVAFSLSGEPVPDAVTSMIQRAACADAADRYGSAEKMREMIADIDTDTIDFELNDPTITISHETLESFELLSSMGRESEDFRIAGTQRDTLSFDVVDDD